jgi:hypothetical protein
MIFWLMAKTVNSGIDLPRETLIDVICISDADGSVVKKTMMFGEWLNLKRLSGYVYRAYQVGFSSYSEK